VLAKAVSQRQQLELHYRKPGQKAEPRIVDPYHLANINGEWFLFAFDQARKDIRTFAPARIQSLSPTGKTFERTQKFSLENGCATASVSIPAQGSLRWLSAQRPRGDYIREKKWHPSQTLRDLKGGGAELKLKLSSLAEVQRWVLSWGGDAEVLKPKELVESVREAARKIIGSK